MTVNCVRPGPLVTVTVPLLASTRACTMARPRPVLPVPDDRARHLMAAMHQRLRDGEDPADALVRARADVQDDSPDPLSGFVCLGAAWPTPGGPTQTDSFGVDRLTSPDRP